MSTPAELMLIVQFPQTTVCSNSIMIVRATSTIKIRPRYLVVPRSIARDFGVRDIKVGKNSQLCGTRGFVPAEVFAGDADLLDARETEPTFLAKTTMDHPIPLLMDACDPSLDIAIEVINLSYTSRHFMGAIFGIPA
jgi:hypothetical protein